METTYNAWWECPSCGENVPSTTTHVCWHYHGQMLCNCMMGGGAYPPSTPRFKVGDRVRWQPLNHTSPYPEERTIVEVRSEVRYRMNGGHTWVQEAELEPVAPAVCSPDAHEGPVVCVCQNCHGKLRDG